MSRFRPATALYATAAMLVAAIATATASPAGTAGKPPAKAAAKAPPVVTLAHRLDLREPFNLGLGKVRVLAFLSPTCGQCIANAALVQQQVLDKNPTDELEVHVVWLKILGSDSREAIDRATTVLSDRRVQHYWDPNSVLNPQLLDAIMFDVGLRLYDIFLLYDRTTKWEQRVPRPPFWMQEYRGAPGPKFDAAEFSAQIERALAGEPLSMPR